jgi:hypothetical protein
LPFRAGRRIPLRPAAVFVKGGTEKYLIPKRAGSQRHPVVAVDLPVPSRERLAEARLAKRPDQVDLIVRLNLARRDQALEQRGEMRIEAFLDGLAEQRCPGRGR